MMLVCIMSIKGAENNLWQDKTFHLFCVLECLVGDLECLVGDLLSLEELDWTDSALLPFCEDEERFPEDNTWDLVPLEYVAPLGLIPVPVPAMLEPDRVCLWLGEVTPLEECRLPEALLLVDPGIPGTADVLGVRGLCGRTEVFLLGGVGWHDTFLWGPGPLCATLVWPWEVPATGGADWGVRAVVDGELTTILVSFSDSMSLIRSTAFKTGFIVLP